MNFSDSNIRKTQRELSSHRIKLTTKILTYIFKAFVLVLVFGLVSVGCLLSGSFKGIIDTAPEITINDVTPSQYKTTVFDCNEIAMETLVASGANRIYVTIDEIPDSLANAFVAIEDERFYEHNGIDAKGIFRAAYIGITNSLRFTQGASTLTQQLIKNSVFSVELEDSLADRLTRKIQEQYLALKLEDSVQNKRLILENYLNTINLGNNNLGVQSASKNYFNKDVSELTISESAVIAAITQNPYYYNPIRFPEHNAVRRTTVLNNMLEQGYITQVEYDEAIEDDVYSRIQNIKDSRGTGSSAYSYYTDALIHQLMEDLMTERGYSRAQAYNLIYRGGLSIYSCEDSKIQKYVEDRSNSEEIWGAATEYSISYRFQVRDKAGNLSSYTEYSMQKYMKAKYGDSFEMLFGSKEIADQFCNEYREAILAETGGTVVEGSETKNYTIQPQTSVTVIENGTGYVKALFGGRGEKNESLVLNRATESKRQAGSTVKPLLVYSPAIDIYGYTLATPIDDVPYYYSTGQLVHNSDERYKGLVPLRYSLAESRNIPAIKTLEAIGIDTGISYFKNFGITTLTSYDNYLPVALGTCSVYNYEMTAAYTTIANNGLYVKPKLYTKVVDHDGNIILDQTDEESSAKPIQVIKPSTAWLISSAMHSVVTDGTLAGIRFEDGMYVCAKSGTSQNDVDKWTIGFAGNYTVGVWAGYDSTKSFDHDKYGFPYMNLFRDIITEVNKDVDCKAPDTPDDIVAVKICKDSGLLADDTLCTKDSRGSRVVTEYFAKGTEPTRTCTVHRKISICTDTDEVASPKCKHTKDVIRIVKPRLVYDNLVVEDSAFAVTEDMINKKCHKHK